MRQWIKRRIGELGKTQNGLAKAIGVEHPRVSEMVSGKRKVQQEEIIPFAEYLEISPDLVIKLFSRKTALDTIPVIESITSIEGNENANIRQVPMMSWISAGALQETATVDDLDLVTYVEGTGLDPSGDWIALRVDGRSMDKVSPHESIIFVNRNERELVPNGLYVIGDGNGGATYKRFKAPNTFEPVSTKADQFETIKFTEDQQPDIIGRVRKSVLNL